MTLQLSKGSRPNPLASQGFPRWGGWLVVFLPLLCPSAVVLPRTYSLLLG